MNWIYAIREGFESLRKSKLSGLLSIFTVAVSLFLLGIFLLSILRGWSVVHQLKSRLEMEVFLRDGVTPGMASLLESRLTQQPEVDEVLFVSKDEALKEFSNEFGGDALALLGENPLPASFRIRVKTEYHDRELIGQLRDRIAVYRGVDEVVYRFDLLRVIRLYLKWAILIAIVLGGMLLFASIMLVSNTVRLSILTRKDSIEIMNLVGATRALIRRPFIVEGALQGVFGALLSVIGITLLSQVMQFLVDQITLNTRLLSISLLIWGILLGSFGSWLAIRKSLKQTIS